MQNRNFVVILIVAINVILLFAIFANPITRELPSDTPVSSISSDNITQNPILVVTTNYAGQTKPSIEIHDPASGVRFKISQDNPEYYPLLNNMTTVLQSIKYQSKCSISYEEFQRIKTNYRYVALNAIKNISGKYCYTSASCKIIIADEFTVLLKKITGNEMETGCLDSGLIFAYNDRTDAGIWSLGERNHGTMENLTGNVQNIIDCEQFDTGYQGKPGARAIPIRMQLCNRFLPAIRVDEETTPVPRIATIPLRVPEFDQHP